MMKDVYKRQEYVLRLNQMGIQTIDDLNDTMNMLTTAYNQKSLHQLLTTTLPENVHIVYNPYELSTLVDNMHYIGNYEPKGLLLVQDIPRMRYAMYLQKMCIRDRPNISEAFGFHELFHIFVMLGSLLHYFAIILFIL